MWFFKVFPALSAFILNRSRRIPIFNPMVVFYKVNAVPGLIPHRPNNHRRMVFVPFHHPIYSVMMHFSKFGFISWRFIFIIPKTMAFNVGFINYIDAIFITKLIPVRIIGIMGSPYSIYIIIFKEFYILKH